MRVEKKCVLCNEARAVLKRYIIQIRSKLITVCNEHDQMSVTEHLLFYCWNRCPLNDFFLYNETSQL